MQAVNHLIDSYAALQSTEFSKIKFTVQLGASEPKLRIFQGSYKRHRSKTGTIFLKDLSRICQLSLETSFFTQMGRIFKQTRGSAIGNQISPSLANIAVSYKEQQWYDSHRSALEALRSQVYIIRDWYSARIQHPADGSFNNSWLHIFMDIQWNSRR